MTAGGTLRAVPTSLAHAAMSPRAVKLAHAAMSLRALKLSGGQVTDGAMVPPIRTNKWRISWDAMVACTLV